MNCPCCGSADARDRAGRNAACGSCGHRWRVDPAARAANYARMEGRNAGRSVSDAQKRDHDRMATLAPLLREGLRVIEIGCAEGGLGAAIKARAHVDYTGVEPSRDAAQAARVLDRVLPTLPASVEPFDLLLAFHVLEHLADVSGAAAQWRESLAPGGTLVAEVPRGAGHPLVADDANPEHLHQFTAASLAALFARHGLEAAAMTSGHYESAVYSDCLRLVARPALADTARRESLLARFRSRFSGPFAVYGLGGDFRSYVLPLLGDLPVAALLDSDARRYGERVGSHLVRAYDPARHGALPVLVASLRHGEEIARQLAAAGHPRERIASLAELYGPPLQPNSGG